MSTKTTNNNNNNRIEITHIIVDRLPAHTDKAADATPNAKYLLQKNFKKEMFFHNE